MKAVKCVVAVILGALLGLIAIFTHGRKADARPGVTTKARPPGSQPTTGPCTTLTKPANGEELPVRRPILE